jgi:hypothetical protein
MPEIICSKLVSSQNVVNNYFLYNNTVMVRLNNKYNMRCVQVVCLCANM